MNIDSLKCHMDETVLPLAVLGQRVFTPSAFFIIEEGLIPTGVLDTGVFFVSKDSNPDVISGCHGHPTIAVLSPETCSRFCAMLEATLCSKEDRVWIVLPKDQLGDTHE